MLVIAVLMQNICHLVTKNFKAEIAGYEHDAKVADGKTADIMDIWGQAMPMEAAICGFIAVFGLPSLESELTDPSLLMVAIVIGFLWEGEKWKVVLAKHDVVVENGAPPQVAAGAAAEPAAEPAAAEEEAKPEAEAKAEEPKEEEEKKEEA